jgi:hypothetical protein
MTPILSALIIAIGGALGLYCLVNYPLAVIFAAAFYFFFLRK